jgi:peptidoglycan/LPS O-acetylase OafA/YrhL
MNQQHTDYLHRHRFNSLDGLRAVSILAVIWHHTAPVGVNALLAGIGAQGVQLFFAISGFLITTLLLREKTRNGKIDLKAFYLRRSLRIFPLYYGTLILYIVVVALLEPHTQTGRAFFSNLVYFATYTSNLFVPLDGRVIFYFAWSLAAEEQFYLIWPPLLLIAASSKRAAIILIITLLICICGQFSGDKFLSAVPLPIIMGALLAIALNHGPSYQRLFLFLGQQWSASIAALCLVLSLVIPDLPGFISSLFFTLLVAACVIRDRHPLTAALSLKPVAYIGSISYGMYMLHMLCKNFVVKLCSAMGFSDTGLWLFVLTTLLAIAVATISFNYYESWFLGWKSRFER